MNAYPIHLITSPCMVEENLKFAWAETPQYEAILVKLYRYIVIIIVAENLENLELPKKKQFQSSYQYCSPWLKKILNVAELKRPKMKQF